MKLKSGLVFLFLSLAVSVSARRGPRLQEDKKKLDGLIGTNVPMKGRAGRLFSLFSVVTFKQNECTLASDSTQKGTCLTSSECSDKSGAQDGHCASGFGVCCSFTIKTCPGTVNQNCTYVQNPEYPSATTESSCSITFNRIDSNLCQIRLDFTALTTAQPPTAGQGLVGLCGDSNGDTVTVTSPTGKGPPVVCGDLGGQHMYLETGTSGTAGKIDFSYGSVTATRAFQFKVTYFRCDDVARHRAPSDCVQYFTGASGTIVSYNWPTQMPASQFYASCIRQEKGYCSILYQETTTSTSDAFHFYNAATSIVTSPGVTDAMACAEAYVQIHGAIQVALSENRICGGIFSAMEAETVPGQVEAIGVPFRITTFAMNGLGVDAAASVMNGYSLDYRQKPCSA